MGNRGSKQAISRDKESPALSRGKP